MGEFLDRYNKESKKDELRKESFFYFNDKYFKQPFTEYFIIEQTERFRARQLKFFMPGRVYTFQYNPHTADLMSFFDRRPMIYVIGEYVSQSTGWNILQGVNLNFLPEKAKASFIDTAYTLFGKGYDAIDKMSDEGKIGFIQQINNLVTNWNFMEINFDKRAHIGIEFATRNYDIARIANPVLIEVEDFSMIPYYVPKEFAGKPPAYIYGLYLKTRAELMKKEPINSSKALKIQKKYKKPGGT
jgi:hypothetical protein